jgi:hypothetical protein
VALVDEEVVWLLKILARLLKIVIHTDERVARRMSSSSSGRVIGLRRIQLLFLPLPLSLAL